MSDADARTSTSCSACRGSPSSSPRAAALVQAVEASASTSGAARIVGLVGESGSGKTTVGRCVLRLVEPTAGRVVFDGVDLAHPVGAATCAPIARRMQIIFQDPYSSLNPRLRVEDIIGEALDTHGLAAGRGAAGRASRELLRRVGLDPEHGAALPARILRRPAPAHRHRPRARRRAGLHRRGRAGLGARRVGAGAGAEPDPGPAAGLRADHAVHRPRPLRGRVSLRRRRGDVSRPGHGARAEPRRSTHGRAIPTRRRCSPPRRCRTRRPPRNRIVLQGDIPSPLNPPSGCVFRTRCPLRRRGVREDRAAARRRRRRATMSPASGTTIPKCWRKPRRFEPDPERRLSRTEPPHEHAL